MGETKVERSGYASSEATSAFAASKEKAKELSYYYGQTPTQPLPEDAVIRQHDPLFRADGLGPKQLDATEARLADEKIRWMETYSFSDEGDKVKMYCEFPE